MTNKPPSPLAGTIRLSRTVHGTLVSFGDEKILGSQMYPPNFPPSDPADVPLTMGGQFEIAREPHKWEAHGTGKYYTLDFYTIRSHENGGHYNVCVPALEASVGA
jgi:hypothetical protein